MAGRGHVEGPGTRGRVVVLEIGEDDIRPPWLDRGDSVHVWLREPARPRLSAGQRALAWVVDGGERVPVVVAEGDRRTLLLDAPQAIEDITHERYVYARRPLHTRAWLPYHFVPGDIRLHLFRWLVRRHRRGAADLAFPSWPADASVETLRWLSRRCDAARESKAFDAGRWPHGHRYAFVVSHDVDTGQGQRRIPDIAAYEDGLGQPATWFVVGASYAIDHERLEALRASGHEIGLHGDRHDNRLAYVSPRKMAHRLDDCVALCERHGIRGFRAPSLLESPALRAELARRFAYASQTPDTETDSLIARRRGCATCFPFVKDGLLEIPITLPMEDKLLLQGMGESEMLALWRRKLQWVRQVGGVAQLALHAEPHLADRCRGAFQAILREVAGDPGAWRTTLGGLARWWEESRSA